MKYKIKNHIIDATSPVEALKIHKLLTSKVKDAKNYKIYQKTPWGEVFIAEWEHESKEEAVKEFLEFNPKYANRGVIIAKDSVKDNDLDYLTEEEEKAVDDYRKAIENTSNPKLLKLYQHILEEELEHIEELTSAEITEDACKTKDYQPPYAIWVKKNGKWKVWGGTHSTSVDKSAFIKEGYEDVKVVKNGEDVKDACKTKDMRLPDYKEAATYLHSLSKHITQMSRSEEFSKQEAIKFVNDVEREANSIINKAKQEINSLTWLK